MRSLVFDTFSVPSVSELVDHLGYAGKGIRPRLTLACGQLCQQEGPSIDVLAKSVEYVHMASLFHDDVIDNGVVRRGKPCAHTIWGNRTSILVGDFLISHVFFLLLTLDNLSLLKAAQRMLQDLIEGQLEENQLSIDCPISSYLSLIQKKTASLFSFACGGVGLLTQQSVQQCQALSAYGCLVGQGFQMVDDVYDYCPLDKERKSIGQDWLHKKVTLPLLLAYHSMTASKKKELADAFFCIEEDAFSALVTLIKQEKGFQRALDMSHLFSKNAVKVLSPLWNETYLDRSGLKQLAFRTSH